MSSLTNQQKERIVKDIINHESEGRGTGAYPPHEIDSDRDDLTGMSDTEILNFWRGTVGEWLCSIGGEYPSFIDAWEEVEGTYDNPADWQLEKLLNGEDTDYGYQFPAY